MSGKRLYRTSGPFRADQLHSGDPYELSDGHPIECLPSGGRHSKAYLSGGLALETDPAVESAGFDTGFTPNEKNLRAPDIAIGNVPDHPDWVPGTPPLAVEYADSGQDQQDLQDKILTLLGGGDTLCLGRAPHRGTPGGGLRAEGTPLPCLPGAAPGSPGSSRQPGASGSPV